MKLEGNFGSDVFNYIEIKAVNCNRDDCMPLDELMNQSINFISLKSYPSLLKQNNSHDDDHNNAGEGEVIEYCEDFSYFKYIEPFIKQSSNIFFQKSKILLKDNIMDVFDWHEDEVVLFEPAKREDYHKSFTSS